MEQKRVSFKIAKAIKEAGYPQSRYEEFYVERDYNSFRTCVLYEPCNTTISSEIPFITAPTYFEVWLWLWREKEIYLGIDAESYPHDGTCVPSHIDAPFLDPEDALEAEINYLVDNNLIK